MEELKRKSLSNDENADENLINLKRLHDGYSTIVEKLGYGKFKPYLQRLFQSVEIMLKNEEIEFKKIDAKYQDMVRQCHIYEKTLSMLKENNCCELSSFSESSNTYALDDFTKVTPYLAPDLLQSTLGATNTNVNTSIQYRLQHRQSSLTNRQYVSTPLGVNRATTKPSVPLAHFDDDPSFGFPPQRVFVDAATDPHPIEQKDVSCQINPILIEQQIETIPFVVDCQSTQTEPISTQTIACQINSNQTEMAIQTDLYEQKDFSIQVSPNTNDQIIETNPIDYLTESIQTDLILTNDYSCQITPEYSDQNIETNPMLKQDIGLQSSFENFLLFEHQESQTDFICQINVDTQYEDLLPILNEIEIKTCHDQQCQTNNFNILQENQSTQTLEKIFHHSSTQSTCFTYDNQSTQTLEKTLQHISTQSNLVIYQNQSIQTEYPWNCYSSSIYILPTAEQQSICSSKVIIYPKPYRDILTSDQTIQCNLSTEETIVSIPIETELNINNRQSVIQQQLDEKEKQMNRIIGKANKEGLKQLFPNTEKKRRDIEEFNFKEYATLYGEYETERRRNMDLTEARDRLADHIKVLSDELGDREINQEILLIKSCQQNKLINYMLPQIDCSPTPKKKHHSASSFRRLLPKFK